MSMFHASSQPASIARRSPLLRLKKWTIAATGTMAIALSFWGTPGWAADPFRSSSPRPIGDRTEAAFRAMFEQGNYVAAEEILRSAESNEPLNHAMRASLAYLDGDWETLETSATATRETAEQLLATDPLRGNLYIAVGHFLEGGYLVSTQGLISATPAVLGKLQQVFDHLDQAEAISPTDPELNLLRGYMDLMLAVNLPFSDPNQAIERLRNYAAPPYLAQRGIALGYRDLDEEEEALEAVDQAIALTPGNPDLYYLRAQILVRQGNDQSSLEYFERALAMETQMPQVMANQLAWEHCRASNRANNTRRNCTPLLNREQ